MTNSSTSSESALPAKQCLYWPSWRVVPQKVTVLEILSDSECLTSVGKLNTEWLYPLHAADKIQYLHRQFCTISHERSKLRNIATDPKPF